MDTVADFEDILAAFESHEVRYLIIGGLAVIFHAIPRYTKDIDIWLDPERDNVDRANDALREFGSPHFLSPENPEEILQIGLPPHRIDILRSVEPGEFADAWEKRIEGRYGEAKAWWVDLDTLIAIKSRIDNPRHQEDVRVLRDVKRRRDR